MFFVCDTVISFTGRQFFFTKAAGCFLLPSPAGVSKAPRPVLPAPVNRAKTLSKSGLARTGFSDSTHQPELFDGARGWTPTSERLVGGARGRRQRVCSGRGGVFQERRVGSGRGGARAGPRGGAGVEHPLGKNTSPWASRRRGSSCIMCSALWGALCLARHRAAPALQPGSTRSRLRTGGQHQQTQQAHVEHRAAQHGGDTAGRADEAPGARAVLHGGAEPSSGRAQKGAQSTMAARTSSGNRVVADVGLVEVRGGPGEQALQGHGQQQQPGGSLKKSVRKVKSWHRLPGSPHPTAAPQPRSLRLQLCA
ncbi:unnamed protein product [Caretta caretta]